MNNYNLGIDIGGTFIKYALVDEKYNIKEKWKIKTIKFETKEELYDYIVSNIRNINDINAIGISAPGLIDEESNVKSYAAPSVRVMYGSNINKEITKRTGKKVASINDAKSAGLCEFKIGNAANSKSSVFLILGTGTGGCVCDDKGVVYGKDGFAGEFHHLPFFNFKTGQIDRLGDYASITALIQIYNEKVEKDKKLEFGHEICHKYLKKEKEAVEAMEQWINNIVVQLITLTTFYNPDVICIGGGISEEDWFIALLKKRYYETCKKHLEGDIITTKIDKCRYNNDANILGAIINVLDKNRQ